MLSCRSCARYVGFRHARTSADKAHSGPPRGGASSTVTLQVGPLRRNDDRGPWPAREGRQFVAAVKSRKVRVVAGVGPTGSPSWWSASVP
jgi:hypothetical protein